VASSLFASLLFIPVFELLTYGFSLWQLVIDKNLTTLPRRKTDGAIIIRSQDSDDGKARAFKLNTVNGDPVLLERYICSNLHLTSILTKTSGVEATNDSTGSIVLGVLCPLAINQRHFP
jgi:hypothetical protein